MPKMGGQAAVGHGEQCEGNWNQPDRPPCFLLECGNYSCNRRSTSAPFHAHCTQLSAPHPFRFQLKVFPASCLTHPSFRFVIGDIKSDIPLPRVSSTRHASDAPLPFPRSPPRSEPRIERGGAWLPRCLPYLSTDERATRTTPPTRRPTDRPRDRRPLSYPKHLMPTLLSIPLALMEI